MNYITNLRRPSLTTFSETASSYGTPVIPPVDAHAARIAREAEKWRAFASERSRMTAPTLQRKALASCAFSVARGASSFAVPSKLSGTREHQRRLWAMVRELAAPWSELTLDATDDRLIALYDGDPIGEVQPKHLPWLRPLVPFGARLYLSAVTGSQRDRATLGLNVVVGHVGTALGTFTYSLGQSSDEQGDGVLDDPLSAPNAVPESAVVVGSCAQQAASLELPEPPAPPLRLVVLPEHEALTADADDVVLWRRLDGSGHASVPHLRRHSDGLDWGRLGAGPSDLAFSVLAALCGAPVAERHAADFAREVVTRLPLPGGVLRAREVRAWAAARRASEGA